MSMFAAFAKRFLPAATTGMRRSPWTLPSINGPAGPAGGGGASGINTNPAPPAPAVEAAPAAGAAASAAPVQSASAAASQSTSVGAVSSEPTLAIGNDPFAPPQPSVYPPTGEYSTTYDQLLPNSQRASPAQNQQQLALPDSNAATHLFRVTPNHPVAQTHGTVEPQGPAHGARPGFSANSSGGGHEIVTPSASWQAVQAAQAAHAAAPASAAAYVPPVSVTPIATGKNPFDTE